jgi:hypothetical protein
VFSTKKRVQMASVVWALAPGSVWYVPFGAHVMQVKVLVSAWNLEAWRRGFGLSWQVLRSDCNLRWIQLGDATSAGQINLLRQWQRDSILDGLVDGH